MKVMFLDIDGVLTTPSTGFAKAVPSAVSALNRILDETDALVVVHSTWRLSWRHCLNSLAEWGVPIGRILAPTPVISTGTKGQEVLAWLQEHAHEVSRFVILDDEPDEFDEVLAAHLVTPDPNVGLVDDEADVVIRILGGDDD